MRTPRAGCCLTAALVVLVVAACSDPSSPTGGGDPGIRLIDGFNLTDTAFAQPKAPLVVEVRDSSGALVPRGTGVRFSAVMRGGTTEMFMRSLTAPPTSGFVVVVAAETDATGRASVSLKLGPFAGPAHIVVDVPAVGVEDTARYTVRAGRAADVMLFPTDTALYTGGSFTLRRGVVDSAGALLTDPVTYTVTGPGISVNSSGVVSASAIGRYTVVATAGSLASAASISVVPHGTMVAASNPVDGSGPARIVSVALDGSGFRDLTGFADVGVGAQPTWMPGSNRIIFSNFEPPYQILRVVDQDGNVTPFITNPPATMTHQAEPSPSLNGSAMYFSAYDTRCSAEFYCLYRSAADGSAPELLGPLFSPVRPAWRPSSSPDGSRVAFVTSGSTGPVIRVFDYASNSVLPWGVKGQSPSWSPDGSRIAFVPETGGPLHLINAADGGGERVLTPASRTYMEAPIGWSPDSKWLLARANVLMLDLIEVSTGQVLPLGYSASYLSGSLK